MPKLIAAVTQSDIAEPLVLPGTTDPVTPSGSWLGPGWVHAGLQSDQWTGPTAIAVLIIFILVAARERRWKVLSMAFLDVAIGLGLTAAIMWFAPGFVLQNIVTAGQAVLKTALEPFITSILHDIAWQFVIAALGALAVSLVLRIIGALLHLKQRFIKPRAPKPPKVDPSSFPQPPGRLQN